MKNLFTLLTGIVFFLFTGIASAQSYQIDLAKGLIANYPFHNKQSNSVVAGAPDVVLKGADWTENRFGDPNSALSFKSAENNGRLTTPKDWKADPDGEYTISLWIKPRDDNSGCIILREGDFGLKWNGMRKPLSVFDGIVNGYPIGRFDDWSSSNWYHLALVKREGRISLYINGLEDQFWNVEPKGELPKRPIFLGKHPYFWGNFTGYFDDLSLYSRALSPYEVATLSQLENIPLKSVVSAPKANFKSEELLGTWQGIINQPENELVENYAYWIHLTKDENGMLKGYTRIEVPREDAYGVSQMQGVISGDAFSFEETKIQRQKNYLGYRWCKKYGQLAYDPEKDALMGTWFANNCQLNGELLLYRTNEKFNYYDTRLSRTVSLDELMKEIRAQGRPSQNSAGIVERDSLLRIELDPILFETDQSELTVNSKIYIEKEIMPVVYPLSTYYRVVLKGYTDNVGNDQYNLTLSKSRAKMVYDFLIRQGMDREKLAFEGYGEANPIAANSSPTGRKANRRVEFHLVRLPLEENPDGSLRAVKK